MAEPPTRNERAKKKPSRSQSRRDTENAVFYELAELLPVTQDMKQDKLSVLRLTLAYMKLRDGLDTDEQDLEQCLATADNILEPPNHDSHSSMEWDSFSEKTPVAMLDNDGNLVAGALNGYRKDEDGVNIKLPDNVLSKLEETFISSSQDSEDDKEKQLEKLQKYKEGLERGMQEFLSQNIFVDESRPTFHQDEKKQPDISPDTKQSSKKKAKSNRKKHKESSNNSSDGGSVVKTSQNSVSEEDKYLSMVTSLQVDESKMMLEAAPGFLLSLDREKRVLFVSENVTDFLGHLQSYIIGQDVSEFVCEKDYPELEKQMNDDQFEGAESEGVQPWQVRRTFYVALKFCFQKPGSRSKDSGHALYQWNAKLRLCRDQEENKILVKGLVSLCRPVITDTLMTFRNNGNTFLIRYGLNLKIIYADFKLEELTGYKPSDVIGASGAHFKHPCDLLMCKFNYKNMLAEGKGESGYYRMLTRQGFWMWVFTQCTVNYDKAGNPVSADCRSFVISKEEAEQALSRERSEYLRMKGLGFGDVFSTGTSEPTLASIAAAKERKSTILGTDFECRNVKRSECHATNSPSSLQQRKEMSSPESARSSSSSSPSLQSSSTQSSTAPKSLQLSKKKKDSNTRKKAKYSNSKKEVKDPSKYVLIKDIKSKIHLQQGSSSEKQNDKGTEIEISISSTNSDASVIIEPDASICLISNADSASTVALPSVYQTSDSVLSTSSFSSLLSSYDTNDQSVSLDMWPHEDILTGNAQNTIHQQTTADMRETSGNVRSSFTQSTSSFDGNSTDDSECQTLPGTFNEPNQNDLPNSTNFSNSDKYQSHNKLSDTTPEMADVDALDSLDSPMNISALDSFLHYSMDEPVPSSSIFKISSSKDVMLSSVNVPEASVTGSPDRPDSHPTHASLQEEAKLKLYTQNLADLQFCSANVFGKLDYPDVKSMIRLYEKKNANSQQTSLKHKVNFTTNNRFTFGSASSTHSSRAKADSSGSHKHGMSALNSPYTISLNSSGIPDNIVQTPSQLTTSASDNLPQLVNLERNKHQPQVPSTANNDIAPTLGGSPSSICDQRNPETKSHTSQRNPAAYGGTSMDMTQGSLMGDDMQQDIANIQLCSSSDSALPEDLMDLELDSEIVTSLSDTWTNYL